jgi:probable rRNA maturation factor
MLLSNRQRKVPISSRALKSFVTRLLVATGQSEDAFSVTLISDRAMQALNRRFRSKNRPTDVLSFPASPKAPFWNAIDVEGSPILGEIVISVDTAKRQARQEGHSITAEIKLLIIHGALHLMGYDHEADNGEMNRREYALRAKFL